MPFRKTIADCLNFSRNGEKILRLAKSARGRSKKIVVDSLLILT